MTPALKTYIELWLDKAEHDLLSAQRLLEIEPMIIAPSKVESWQDSNLQNVAFE